jgi:uncharacterized RDD family membrane protein YckC
MSSQPVPYAGIATRALALALDVAVVQVVVFATGAVLALVGSLVFELDATTGAKVAAACGWILAVDGYFVLFWATAGQTPAMRLMEIRVMAPDGAPPGIGRSIVRLIGLGLAIIPLFAGFLPVLVDDRRRGLHDMLAGTIVVHAGFQPAPLEATAPAVIVAEAGHEAPA